MGLKDAQQISIVKSSPAPQMESVSSQAFDAPLVSEGAVQAVKTAGSTGLDVAKSAGSGAARGVASVFGAGGDIQSMIDEYVLDPALQSLKTLPEEEKAQLRDINLLGTTGAEILGAEVGDFLPTTEDVYTAAGKVSPAAEQVLRYQPETGAGRVTQTAGEFIGSTVGAMPSAVVRGKKLLSGMGLLGTTVGGLEEMDYGKTSTAVGVGVPLAASVLLRRPTTMERAASRASADDIQQAKNLMRKSKEQGVGLTSFEALGREGAPIAEQISRSPSVAPQVRSLLEERAENMPQAMMAVSREVFGEVDPQTLNKDIDDIMTASMRKARKTQVALAGEAGYDAAAKQMLDTDTLKTVYRRVDKVLSDPTITLDAEGRKKAQDMVDAILKTSTSVKGDRKFVFQEKNALAIEKAYKKYYNNIASSDADTRKVLKVIDNMILSQNQNIQSGRAAYKAFQNDVIEDMGMAFNQKIKAGVGEGSLEPSDVDSLITGNFQTAPSVRRVAKYLNQAQFEQGADVQAFPKVVAHMLRTKAVKLDTTGTPLSAGRQFALSVRGNPNTETRKVFEATLDNVAQSYSKSKAETQAFKKAVNDQLDILERTGNVQGFQSMPTDAGMMSTIIPKMAINDANRSIQILDRVVDAKYKRNIEALTKTMMDEKGVDLLIKIGKRPKNRALKSQFQALLAYNRQNIEDRDYASVEQERSMAEQEQQTLLPVPQEQGMGIGKPMSELNLSLLGQ